METQEHDYINARKIIMTHTRGKEAGQLYPVYYPETRPIGSSSNTMYQVVERGDKMKSMLVLLNSRIIEFLMKITQYSETPNHKNEYKILNSIAKPMHELKNDNDVYTYYSINKTEIRMIDKILGEKPRRVKSRKLYCKKRGTRRGGLL